MVDHHIVNEWRQMHRVYVRPGRVRHTFLRGLFARLHHRVATEG